MAAILLIANLNCDRVMQLDNNLYTGGRFHYQDQGRRLGGGGANTGLALVYAQHQVTLVSQVGNDETSDWLLAQASILGLDCHLLQRHQHDTPELLLLMTPDAERTIIRPIRPTFTLPSMPNFNLYDALYINSSAIGIEDWAAAANHNCLVVSQLAKDLAKRPAHILITSYPDLQQHFPEEDQVDYWAFAQSIAGDGLEYFIVTDGENGSVAYQQNKTTTVPAVNVDVVDNTGAGDAYAAGLIDALLQDLTIKESMQQASHWAAIAVTSKSSIPGEAFKQYLSHH